MNQIQLDRIEEKLDKLLNILGEDPKRSKTIADLRREAQATVLQFQSRKNKKGVHERENKGRE